MVTASFWFFAAFLFAAVEVEIEGEHGWAEKLPTWTRIVSWSSRPVTGYHCVMFCIPIAFVHAQFASGMPWSVVAELDALAHYAVFIALWDYLWFVLNPHYGPRMRKERIWWHAGSRWVFELFPIDYLYALIASVVLAAAAGHLSVHLTFLGWTAALLTCTILASPLYHRWYWRMRA